MLAINVDSANVTCTTASEPRQMLTTKLFTMHLVTVGFKKFGVVWKLIYLTYSMNMNI